MSWNATVDRLRAQAQQYGLANDYVTAKLLYEALDEITRMASRVPNPDDLRRVLRFVSVNAPEGASPLVEAVARVRATMEES